MCEYAKLITGQCNITKDICPYLYFCYKTNTYKESKAMPINCRQKQSFEMPKEFYKVCYERHGQLYVDVDGCIEIVDNPYNYVPSSVKMSKMKSGKWKIKQAMG